MVEITLNITGLDDLYKRLASLPGDIAEAGMTDALEAGAEILGRAIVAFAPKKTGELASDIGYNVMIGRTVDVGFADIGPIFAGKRAHKSRSGGAPSTEDPGVWAQWLEYGHEGAAPHPFMRPAFDTAGELAIDAFAKSMETTFGELPE